MPLLADVKVASLRAAADIAFRQVRYRQLMEERRQAAELLACHSRSGWLGGFLLPGSMPSDSRHAGRRISPNGRKSLASAVDEVDVRFVHNANLLHSFPQVGRLREGLRTVEIFCLKQQDDFIRLLRSPKKVPLRKSCFNALWKVSVLSALPLREVPDFVPDKHVAGHKPSLRFTEPRSH